MSIALPVAGDVFVAHGVFAPIYSLTTFFLFFTQLPPAVTMLHVASFTVYCSLFQYVTERMHAQAPIDSARNNSLLTKK